MIHKPNFLYTLAFLLVFSTLFFNCKKENSSITKQPVVIKDTSIVNRFIYKGLQEYYLWTALVPKLAPTKYTNADSLNLFLNGYSDPQKIFKDLLYQPTTVDKWSFLVSDSLTITNWIQGISETMGYDFMLGRIGTSDNLFGFVRYVYKGSPAEKAGMKRGDLFMKINDTQITVANYQTLLFSTITYKLSFASVAVTSTGYSIATNGKSVNMTAITMQENPILLDTVLNVNNLKVGYLVYNGFNADYDIQLNDVFKKFKDAAIDKLVLDLRYNGGGSVQTAKYLASMIYGTATTNVFFKSQYNQSWQTYILSTEGAAALSENFTDKIAQTSTTPATPINTLNMTSLYVITSGHTASASELLINGLKPYMQVFSVGTKTVGKYVASITITDRYVTGNRNNKYAMQPIIVKMANANGVTDFIDGLAPDFVIEEDMVNLLPFGSVNETLLKPVLNKIQGLPLAAFSLKSEKIGLKNFYDAQSERPFSQNMYINKPRSTPIN